MSYDKNCRLLAKLFLSDYTLNPAEQTEETERLAQAIQTAIEAELENLEHRRKA